MASSAGRAGTTNWPHGSAEEAAWLRGACSGEVGTVGALMPTGYDVIVRLSAPDDAVEDWVDAYRAVFVRVASLGEGHTTTPRRAWFAHEHGNDFGLIRPPGFDASDVERGPLLIMPRRTYRLATGAVASVGQLRGPGLSSSWRHPDLFWPADRSWFVATDVDFWSLYVAGSVRFVTRLMASARSPLELVEYSTPLVFEE